MSICSLVREVGCEQAGAVGPCTHSCGQVVGIRLCIEAVCEEEQPGPSCENQT